ncbi:MAG: allene oxide cyclase barrel-like domain-containing protein [Actinomycetota bacterium]
MRSRHATGRRRAALVVVAALLVVTAPATLMAADDFVDVEQSDTFHDDISWMADNGITFGCNPPENTEYCPEREVTRGEMAAFLRRLATNEVVQAAPTSPREDVEVFITPDGKEQTHLSLTGEEGLVDGNARVEHGRLVDGEGNEVGTVVSRFHYIDVRDAEAGDFLFYLDCTIRLDDGSIVFGGAGEFADIPAGGEEFAIVGGTGAYSDATGQVTIAPGDLGTGLHFQFDS